MIPTTTNSGLHEFVQRMALSRFAKPGSRAVDLGSGPGAMAERLKALGFDVLAVDISREGFQSGVPHVLLDLNLADFASGLGLASCQLVTAIEVIEHVESPIGFLRNIGRLLAPGGVAVITTPNVDSLPARLRFFLSSTIRTMDVHGEPTHISPIFWDLFQRQFLPRSGLRLREHLVFPPAGFQLTRQPLAFFLRLAALCVSGDSVLGDNHVLILECQA